jgi:hypothetical protein
MQISHQLSVPRPFYLPPLAFITGAVTSNVGVGQNLTMNFAYVELPLGESVVH